ncbi:MAG: hydrogenase small subunit, partial [Halobacteriales archaeon]
SRVKTPMTDQSRRNFLKLAGTMATGAVASRYTAEIASAYQQATEGKMEVVWLQGQSCSGCTISMLQGQYPTLEETLREFRLAVTFHPTIMAEHGDAALESMSKSPDVLVVEGSVPTEMPSAATLGKLPDGTSKPLVDWVTELANEAEYVIGLGNCASFGGWPAAENKQQPHGTRENVTGAKGLQFEQRQQPGVLGPDFTAGSGLPVINLGGCPPHPDYMLLTIATVLNGHVPELDQYQRPKPFYEPLVHDNCNWRGYFDRGEFADKPGEEGCLYQVGCAGPYTHCDDQTRLWNDGTSVCLNVGAPCIGCMEPGFWDRFQPLDQEVEQQNVFGVDAETAGLAAVGAGVVGIGVHATRKLTGYGTSEGNGNGGHSEDIDAEHSASDADRQSAAEAGDGNDKPE